MSLSLDEVKTNKAPFQELRDIFAWSYEEMLGIDPNIIVHKIKMYPNVKTTQQCLHPVHPNKAAAIKVEVEKIL